MEHDILENAELYANSAMGIYIPKYFAESVNREMVKNVSEEDYDDLSDPENENYWLAWEIILENAVLTDSKGKKWRLYQDGDLWLVPSED